MAKWLLMLVLATALTASAWPAAAQGETGEGEAETADEATAVLDTMAKAAADLDTDAVRACLHSRFVGAMVEPFGNLRVADADEFAGALTGLAAMATTEAELQYEYVEAFGPTAFVFARVVVPGQIEGPLWASLVKDGGKWRVIALATDLSGQPTLFADEEAATKAIRQVAADLTQSVIVEGRVSALPELMCDDLAVLAGVQGTAVFCLGGREEIDRVLGAMPDQPGTDAADVSVKDEEITVSNDVAVYFAGLSTSPGEKKDWSRAFALLVKKDGEWRILAAVSGDLPADE
jgi:hypothetical protein